MSGKAYLTWALTQEGNLEHIDKVPNGNECGCICPYCKSALCAKNGSTGEKKIHHFAHQSGSDCVGAIESALHKMAKDILFETKCVKLPNRFDGRVGEQLHFDRVEVELFDKDTNLRPDCIGYYGNNYIWIEFKRTHEVDTKKKGKIISAHIDCVEIDLNGCTLDPVAVKEFIISSTERRKWIRDISISNRKAGHSSSFGSCDRYDDYYDEYRHRIRTFAKDENGQLVNLKDDEANMNEHSYYCLACGKELTIDVDKDGTYYFIHVENDTVCDDNMYLQQSAREILYDRFCRTNQFLIEVPQHYFCAEKSSCAYYNEEHCYNEEKVQYDLIKYGYTECLKDYDYSLSDGHNKCDLVIKRPDSFEKAILISITSGQKTIESYPSKNRCIVINIEREHILNELIMYPIGGQTTSFINFKRDGKKTVQRTEVNRTLIKFELFSSGKYFVRRHSCSAVDKRKSSTIFELLFVNEGEVGYDDTYYDFDNIKTYSLLRCYQLKKKACYCEICFFINEVSSFGISEKICKRYKTKKTPHYPLKEMPIECQFFSINKSLAIINKEKNKDIAVIERDYLETSDNTIPTIWNGGE